MSNTIETMSFLNEELVRKIANEADTPVFVYSKEIIEDSAEKALAFPNAFGVTVRYAMKANPNRSILKVFDKAGIHIDASSEFEVYRAIAAGVKGEKILLTSQQLPRDFKQLMGTGAQYNACSMHQLREYGKAMPGTNVSVRFNPGRGSGGTKKTDVGGPSSSFGIWLEYADEVKAIAKEYDLTIERIHTHIGSGSDPDVWEAVSEYTLELVEQFPDVKIVNLGGGFKVGRMADEVSTDLQKIGQPVKTRFEAFAKKHGRELHLEIEPGTFLIALSGAIVMEVIDKVDTGDKGYDFLKVNTGMDSNTRPSLYNARHPLITVPREPAEGRNVVEYVVVGHCCESGDIFTVKDYGDPDPRPMEECEIGDYMVMEGVGAYCSSMCTKNYNSYPEMGGVLVDKAGNIFRIRNAQDVEGVYMNEVVPSFLE